MSGMSRGPQSFKQRDVAAAIKAARAAGLEVQRVEVDRDGKIVIVTRHDGQQSANFFDEKLKP